MLNELHVLQSMSFMSRHVDKYCKQLESTVEKLRKDIDAEKHAFEVLESKHLAFVDNKENDVKNYKRQIDIMSGQVVQYDQIIKNLRTVAICKLEWLDKENLTAADKIMTALNHISELQDTNKKLAEKIKETESTLSAAYQKAVHHRDSVKKEFKAYKEKIMKPIEEIREFMHFRKDVDEFQILSWFIRNCKAIMERRDDLEKISCKLRRRRNQLIDQLRENGIKPVNPK